MICPDRGADVCSERCCLTASGALHEPNSFICALWGGEITELCRKIISTLSMWDVNVLNITSD